jgi:hypothetical protein
LETPNRREGRICHRTCDNVRNARIIDVELSAEMRQFVAIRRPACERPLRLMPDVTINLLKLNSGVLSSRKPGAIHIDHRLTPFRSFANFL